MQRRVAFLYAVDWSKEFRDHGAGLVPGHRLFGAADLADHGLDVVVCSWGRAPRRIRNGRVWKLWQGSWVLVTQQRVSCVVATTEAAGLPTLLLRAVGLLRKPVVVLAVAVLSDSYRGQGPGPAVRRWLLRRADTVVTYASGQRELMARDLGIARDRITFIPFGVDVDFFPPVPAEPIWDVVAVGTNAGKDYPTLVQALPPGASCLVVTDSYNAEQARSVRTAGDLTIDHDVAIVSIRERYAAARRIVVPLRDVDFSSGQTVLLETLAMGKDVVVSDTVAVRDYVDDTVATIVPPGDVEAMRTALEWEPTTHRTKATEHVARHFSSRRFAADLADVVRRHVASGR